LTNKRVIERAITAADPRDKARILAGNASGNQAYAGEIGADGYATEASSAVRVVRKGLLA
jgi:methanogenic corrinoid protein MtbC1